MVWFWPFLFLFSCFLCTLLTPFSITVAEGARAIDRPDGARKTHPRPTPRLGGLGVFLSVALSTLFFLSPSPLLTAWLTGGALLCALGVSDDIFSLSPRLKMTAMLFIALLPVCFGLAPRAVTLGNAVFSLPLAASTPLTVLWLLTLTNAYNLIDGLDGLAASQGLASALGLSLFGGSAPPLLLAGALLGFLPYNRPALGLSAHTAKKLPTRSFLGDTGALFIGYSLGVLSLGEAGRFSLFSPLLFALPLYELFSSFFRRLLKGKNPFAADGDHLHHRLLRSGLSPSPAVLLLLLYALLFAALCLFAQAVLPLL